MFTLDAMTLVVITSVIIPLIVGIITKRTASAEVKTVMNIVVTAVVTLIGNAMNESGVAVFSQEMIVNFILALVISISTYYGVYKPVDIPGKTLPNKGIG
jgi:hypothetical protein